MLQWMRSTASVSEEHALVREACIQYARSSVAMVQAFIKQTRRRLLLAPYNELVNVHLMVLRQASLCSAVSAGEGGRACSTSSLPCSS